MTKYEEALNEIKGIAETEAGACVCSFRACDGAIGVAVTVRGRMNRSDPDYCRLKELVAHWYSSFHDARVAEWSFDETNDGFGARLYAVELKGTAR